MNKTIKIATRPSRLAVTQSQLVADMLKAKNPAFEFELVKITTHGDKDQATPISQFGGTGVFVKELEKALLDGVADLAVHSLKDVPSKQAEGLDLVSYPLREDTRDVLITKDGIGWRDLVKGAIVGTSSPGRLAQLKRLRPDLQFKEIRGNVDTRINKVQNGDYDATILAAAGLNRLGIKFPNKAIFQLREMVPSPGQGALVLQCRAGDAEIRNVGQSINHPITEAAVHYERQFMALMDGGCRHPLAANIAIWDDDIAYRFLIGDKITYAFEEVQGNCLYNDIEALVQEQSIYFKNIVREREYVL